MADTEIQRISFWKSLSKLDWLALGIALAGLFATWVSVPLHDEPGMGFLRYLSVIALFYIVYRFWSRWRGQLLWSLRNRLIVAYMFIAFVPIILLLILAVLAAQIIYSQLGAYLLYEDIQHRIEMLAESTAEVAAAEATLPGKIQEEELEEDLKKELRIAERKQLPGLTPRFHVDQDVFHKIAGPGAESFAGLVQSGNSLRLVSMQETETPRGKRVIELSLPMNSDFLEGVAPDLGPLNVTLSQRVEGDSNRTAVKIGENNYRAIARITTRKRVLPEAQSWTDPLVDGFSKLEATYISGNGEVERNHPVFAFFQARNSQLNRRIFASVGEFSDAKLFGLQIVSVVFLLIEIVALIIGVVLTQAITRTVSGLYRATQFVQEGNFSHRVRVERKDQLGVLGESFNSMTGSISRLINEQKQLQRLENEIVIAREVQDQLFPRNLPHVEGVEVEAICRAARSVSGDYYDFIQLSPTHVAFAIADISGKGISAALLMASLQAALRSQLLVPGSETMSTAELVARLNIHLVRNTGDDRFATFFIAIYDTVSRQMRYTNAGHLPAFCISGSGSTRLGEGGIVLGVMEQYSFEEGCIFVPPDSVLIGYSDGLIEPENAYGEQFGIPRLEAAAQRVRQLSPRKIAEALMVVTEEWAGEAEQADDMTVIVAKLK
ncbi:MAG: PP2C family protein-serine/threonine phosphatase [Candidatus Acidiferrum sp.]